MSEKNATRAKRLPVLRDPTLRQALRMLERDLRLPIGEVAATFGLNLRKLQRLARKEMGADLRSWRTDRRLEKLRHLLATTDLPIGEIGVKCGLPDPANLAHLFRQHFGVAPRDYRELYLTMSRRKPTATRKRSTASKH